MKDFSYSPVTLALNGEVVNTSRHASHVSVSGEMVTGLVEQISDVMF